MKCPVKSNPDWKELVSLVGEDTAYAIYIRNNEEIPNPKDFYNYINYNLRVVAALNSGKVREPESNREGFMNDLKKQGVPDDQLALVNPFLDQSLTKEEIKEQVILSTVTGIETVVADITDYNSFSVPGGVNYKEVEIRTPDLISPIKGHATFSTKQGIGWFRVDDKVGETSTRRVLELQSDLFQKRKKKLKNPLLNLLNSDNNWVSFFVRSILQDSARKGYAKVLFPTGNTANLIEGQDTVEGFIKTKTDRLNVLKEDLASFDSTYKKEVKEKSVMMFRGEKGRYVKKPHYNQTGKPIYEIEGTEGTVEITSIEFLNAYKTYYKETANTEIKQLEKEIKDAEQGRLPFSAINKFYEETIKNTLKKRGYNPVQITDEYGNKWFQVDSIGDAVAFSPNESSIEQVYSDIVINGFNAYTQNEAVSHITEQVIISIENTPGISFNQAITNFVNYAEDQIIAGNDKYEPIVENIDRFRALVLERLSRIGLLVSTKVDENDQINVEGDEVSDSFYWEDDWVFKYNSKLNAQQTIKKFLTFIPKTVYENGEYYEIENYLGTLSFMNYDEVFEDLKAMLSDTPNNWEAMRAKLEESQIQKPWVFNLLFQIDNYEGDKQQLLNQFVTTFSSTYNNFKTLLWEEDKGEYSFKIIDTDQSSVVKNLLTKWQNNFYTLSVKVDSTIAALDELKGNKDIGKIKSFLSSIGIDVTNNTINDLVEGKISGLTYEQHFTSSDKGLFNLIKSRLSGRDANGLDQEDVVNPVVNNSAVRNLANTEQLYNPALYSNSLRNGEGNTVYSYSFNKFITKQFQRLQDVDYVNKLTSVTFNTPITDNGEVLYSTWLNELKTNPSFKEIFTISPFDTVKETGDSGVKLSKMTDIDLEITKWQLFQNKGNTRKGVGKIANYLFTVPSKTTAYVVTAPAIDITVSNNKLGKSAKDALYSIALTELNRINTAKTRPISSKRYKTGSQYFYFFPTLNKDKTPEIWNIDGTVKLPTTKVGDKTVESIIRSEIEGIINRDINNKLDYWKSIGFIEPDGTLAYADKSYRQGSKTSPYLAAADYIVNNTLFEFNLHQTFIGDPAIYYKNNPEATWDEIGKRLAAQIAPGKDLALFSPTEDFISVKVKDREGDIALNTAELKQRLKDKAAPYESLNGTDAQEFTTLKEALLVKYRLGNLTSEVYNNLLTRINKEGDNIVLTPKELGTVLQPDKPVYVNTEINTEEDYVSLDYVKSSSIPLIPQFTKGLELDKLRIAMEQLEAKTNKPVRLAFDSATKVGGIQSIEIFNEDGSIKSDLDLSNSYKVLSREGFRIQQDVPYDPTYEWVVKSTQATKLLFDSNLTTSGFQYKGNTYNGKQLKNLWTSLHKDLFETAAGDLQREITLPDGSLDSSKIQELLVKEATEREYSPAEIASLSILPDGKFEFPFWALNSSKKFESIITSLYTNNIVKQKMHGSSYVLVSEEGVKGKSKGITYTFNYDGQLKPMRIENGVVKGAQILIPWKFKSNINKFIKDGVIDTTKLPEELLEQFGFRIPNQGHNSMSIVEVVGFLPPIMGDIVIASRNFITQMGSDFDVDKLYVYDYFVEEVDGKLVKTDNVKNDILDVHKAVLKNEKVFNSVVTPLDNVKDTDSAKYLKSIFKQQVNNRLSPDYKKAKYLESIDGKAMVGIESLASTLNTTLQEIDAYYQIRVPNDNGRGFTWVRGSIIFGDDSGRKLVLSDLSSPYTWRGNSKNSVISADQSAAVDNEKDPILSYINSNAITAPARTALRQLGLEADHLNYFMAQPILREFTTRVRERKSFLSANKGDIERIIIDQLTASAVNNYLKGLSEEAKKDYSPDYFTNFKLTQSELKRNLTGRESWIDLAVILKFRQAYELGRGLNTIQSAINIESSGIGKSVLETANKANKINELLNVNVVANASAVLGEFGNNGLTATTYSGHAIKNSVLLADDTFSKPNDFFHNNARAVRKAMKEIEKISGRVLTVEQSEAVWNGLKSYTFARLLSTTDREELFFGKNALAHRVKEFLKTKEGRTNQFLIRLAFNTKPDRPQLISYNASKEEYIDEVNIYRSFLDLLLSPNQETKKLGEDLVTYFYLNGGVQQAREWGKYIHPSYLKEYKFNFNERLKEVDFQNLETIGYTEPISDFVLQYFQHNPWMLPVLDTSDDSLYQIKGNTITLIPIDEENLDATFPLSLTSDDKYPPLFTLKDSKSGKGYQIYKAIDDNTFRRIDTLGATNYNEYGDGLSLISKNFGNRDVSIAPTKDEPTNDFKSVPSYSLSDYTGDVNKVLDKITNPKYKSLVELLKEKKYNNVIEIDPSLPMGGQFNLNSPVIKINPAKVKSIERTILHEVIHAATMKALVSVDGLSPSQIEAVNALKRMRESLRERILAGEFEKNGLTGIELNEFESLFKETAKTAEQQKRLIELTPKYYGFYNNEEFVSELFTREEFQTVLNEIKYDSKKSFLDRIIEFVTKLIADLGVTKDSVLEAAIREAVTIITEKAPIKKASLIDKSHTQDYTAFSLAEVEEYTKLIARFTDRLRFIDQSISKAYIEKDNVRVEQLKARREEVETELEAFKEDRIFEGVIKLADKDLANVERILLQPGLSHNDINYTLRVIKQWQTANELVLQESDITDRNQRYKDIKRIEAQASELYDLWIRVGRNSLLLAIQQESGLTTLTNEVLTAQNKVNALTANLMDISRTGNIILSVMDKWMRESAKRASLEASLIHDETSKLAADLKSNPLFKKEGYYVFAQRTENGELTGGLVTALTPEYYTTRNRLLEKASSEYNREMKKAAWSNYFEWMRDNHTFFDIRKLFKEENDGSYTFSPDSNYVNTLKKQYKERYDEFIEEQKQKIALYNERLSYKIQSLEGDPELDRIMAKWKAQYDPAIYLRNVLNNDYRATIIDGEFIRNEGHEFVFKRANKQWEDIAYNKIQNSPELKAFYDHTVKSLNRLYSFLPSGFKEDINSTTIPSISKNLVEVYNEKGMNAAVTQTNNNFIEGISIDEIENETKKLQDPITGKPQLNLNVRYINTLSPEERSYDLERVVNIFATEALAFKHKSTVEDSIRLAQSILEQSLEVVKSPRGEAMVNRFGEVVKVKDGKALQEQMEYAIEAFYGQRKQAQGVTSKKVYTNKAKSKRDRLLKEAKEGKFSKESKEFIKELQLISSDPISEDSHIDNLADASQKYLNKNTRFVAGSKIGDALLQYMQLKGMGWNVFSSITNVIFGWQSNMTYAAGGVDFNVEQMLKANKIMLGATGRGIGIQNSIGRKVNALMTKYNVLGELNDAGYKGSTNANRVKRGMENLSPYELQRRGEYFVQGMTMVALMLNTKVTINGKEASLWDAYTVDGEYIGDNKAAWQGNIESKEENKEYFKLSNKIDQINKAVHGNYDVNSPVRIKKGVLGRALLQFRSWIAEGVANRLEGRKYDLLLGRERKGRWRTYGDLGLKNSLIALTLTARGKDLSQLVADPDLAIATENMKRNLAELYQYAVLMALVYTLTTLDMDDDDEYGKRAVNFTVNQLFRLQDDIEFYYSPLAVENIAQNAVPVFTLVRDGYKFIDALEQGIIEGEWDYKTGKKAGENRVLWRGAKVFPFGSSLASFINKTESEESFRN